MRIRTCAAAIGAAMLVALTGGPVTAQPPVNLQPGPPSSASAPGLAALGGPGSLLPAEVNVQLLASAVALVDQLAAVTPLTEFEQVVLVFVVYKALQVQAVQALLSGGR
jgi:hypothetical protein